MGNKDWTQYIGGYKRAGDLIIEYGSKHGEQHTLVYPLIYLYHHYIELQLKEIIFNGNVILCNNEDLPLGFPHGHDINDLWRKCRTIIVNVDRQEYSRLQEFEQHKYESDLDALGKSIRQFARLDTSSQASRYPIDTDGNASILSVQLRQIKFDDIRQLVESISFLLDGVSQGITEYLDARHKLR